MEPLLELKSVRFSLREGEADLSVKLFPGEVHALLCDSAEGFTGCASVLGFAVPPSGGEWTFLGQKAAFRNPKDASDAGLTVTGGLWPSLSVQDTVLLFLPGKPDWPLWAPVLTRAVPGLTRRQKVGRLSPEDRFRLILALSGLRKSRLLVLLSPMDGLRPDFYDTAADLLKAWAGEDRGVLLLSRVPRHALLCDRCTVFSKGRTVFEASCKTLSARRLREQMTPEDLPVPASVRERTPGAVLMEGRGLSGVREGGRYEVEDVSLELREGEIVGLCALPRQGGEALLALLAGVRPLRAGRLRLRGRVLRRLTRAEFARLGVRYVPAHSPLRPGFLPLSVKEALLCGRVPDRKLYSGKGLLDPAAADRYVRFLLEEYAPGAGEAAPLEDLPPSLLRMLSMASEMDREGPVLLLDHPFDGLDGPQKALLKGILLDEKTHRTAVLVLSDQMDELIDLCDRLIVLHKGRAVLETDCLMPSRHEISLAMSGRRVSGEMVPDEEDEGEEP